MHPNNKFAWKSFINEDDILKSRLVDVLNMGDNIIFEKFGHKQYEEAREEIATELLKNKELSLEHISEVTRLSKDKIETLNASSKVRLE